MRTLGFARYVNQADMAYSYIYLYGEEDYCL